MKQLKTLMSILVKPRYALLAIFVSIIVFTVAVWLPNLGLIYIVLQKATIPEVMSLLWSLYGGIGTNFSLLSASYTTAIAVLFGVNISLLVYYVRRVRRGVGGAGSVSAVGAGGFISGIFGIGCAVCGTFLLTSLLALFGATGILVFLPFGGEEFGILGVILLLSSIFLLLRKIRDPLVCDIS